MFVGNDHFTTPCTRDHLLPLKLEWKINKIKKRQNSKLFFFTVHIKGNPHNLLLMQQIITVVEIPLENLMVTSKQVLQ